MRSEERDEYLIRLTKMVWGFKTSLSGKLTIPDGTAASQAELYKNIDPKNAKAIIAANHLPNRAMHNITT